MKKEKRRRKITKNKTKKDKKKETIGLIAYCPFLTVYIDMQKVAFYFQFKF